MTEYSECAKVYSYPAGREDILKSLIKACDNITLLERALGKSLREFRERAICTYDPEVFRKIVLCSGYLLYVTENVLFKEVHTIGDLIGTESK